MKDAVLRGIPEKGKSTTIMAIGDLYEGKFRNGKPHGLGKMTYKDGRVVNGIWKNGKIEYEGDLVNGKPHGRGKMIYLGGSVIGRLACGTGMECSSTLTEV